MAQPWVSSHGDLFSAADEQDTFAGKALRKSSSQPRVLARIPFFPVLEDKLPATAVLIGADTQRALTKVQMPANVMGNGIPSLLMPDLTPLSTQGTATVRC